MDGPAPLAIGRPAAQTAMGPTPDSNVDESQGDQEQPK